MTQDRPRNRVAQITRRKPMKQSSVPIAWMQSITSAIAVFIGIAFASTGAVAQALPPTVSKVFGLPSIQVGASTTVTFVVANPNPATTLTGVNLTDALPPGLTVATG